ncbi:MAG TPA: EthD family reductase [Ramlibacter sp.]|nr:EthD family reductase [Ramlibacter sp.]
MYKISVMYPHSEGVRFDHDYYRDRHMKLVKDRLGAACKYYTVDKGVAGGAPGAPPAFVGMCHIYADSLEDFQSGMARHGAEIMGDIPNYTDAKPVIQVSEVAVERG